MKVAAVALLAGLAAAAPAANPQTLPKGTEPSKAGMIATIAELTDRTGHLDGGFKPIVRNEVIDSTPCGKVIFIFARASQESTNMGGSVGPQICNGLKTAYGEKEALCQGVGGAYSAGLLDNVSLKGTSAGAIAEATKMFNQAVTKCPQAIITFGGYSQGTAVMHNAVSALPAALKEKIAAGVLYGDTRNAQDKGQVPNFPKDKIQIYCFKDDGVCGGMLNVTNGHFVYTTNGDAQKGFDFLKAKIAAAGGPKGPSKLRARRIAAYLAAMEAKAAKAA